MIKQQMAFELDRDTHRNAQIRLNDTSSCDGGETITGLPLSHIDSTLSVISSEHLISAVWHVFVDEKQMVLGGPVMAS